MSSSPATSTPRAAALPPPLYSPNHHTLQAQPPRSSSLSFASSLQMGSSQSKPALPPSAASASASSSSASSSPASSTSSAVKGLTAAAVNGGFKLKRAFAARRKKSEDASSLFASPKGKESEAATATAMGARGDRGVALSSQVVDRLSVPPLPLPQQSQRMEDAPSPPATSPSPRSQVFHKSVVVSPALPSPPPPTPPPKKETPPSASSASTLHPDAQGLSAAAAAGNNRNSIIPISPGISSAVNYLSMFDQQQQQQQPPQSQSSPQPQPQSQSQSQSQNAGGAITSASLPSKIDPQPQADRENLKSSTSSSGSGGSGSSGGSSGGNDRRDKESWRKSDSTNSHHTIRPGARSSRPASWAESFQSAYTVVVVQPGTASRPISALMGDAEFGTLEEDDGDSSAEAGSSSSSSESSSSASAASASAEHGQRQEKEREGKDVNSSSSASPTPSLRAKEKRNRRSMSLSVITSAPAAAANFKQALVVPPTPPSASAVETSTGKAQPSMSTLDGPLPTQLKVYNKTSRSPPALVSSFSQPEPQVRHQDMFVPSSSSAYPSNPSATALNLQHERSLPALPQHPLHSQHHLNPHAQAQARTSHLHPLSATSASSQTPAPTSTSTSASARTPAISMSAGGLGPAAAGLAKRAVEKMSMGKKWMGLALSHSASNGGHYGHGHAHGHMHEQSASDGGYTSSSSTSGSVQHHHTAGEHAGGFGFALARTSSNTSASGTSNSHHRHHSFFSSSSSPSKSVALPTTGGSGGQHKRTLNAASSISSSASGSESDPFYPSEGALLGRKLRNSLGAPGYSATGTRGWVFKRDLASCVRDTRVVPGAAGLSGRRRGNAEGLGGEREKEREVLIRELEDRALPALVVRCAQHLLLWGVKEEGLFRLTGRPTHVAKLRSEFDSGADYDMTECTPGDLDPHAVASVFRAYLRELPEPILTHKLQPYFDAAITKEASNNASEASSSTPFPHPARMSMIMGSGPGRPIANGLPSGPKSGFNTHPSGSGSGSMSISNPIALRKPPSLSTLAMPAFSVPPPSASLTAALRKLVAQLPRENRDLVRTVVELIQATVKEVKETRMPLSNLLVVFTPSLQMSPGLLRALCEAEGIWVDEERVIDIRRRTVIIQPSPPEVVAVAAAQEEEEEEEEDTEAKRERGSDTDAEEEEEESSLISGSGRASFDTTDNSLSSDYHASAEDDTSSSLSMSIPPRAEEQDGEVPRPRHVSDYERGEVPTMYLSAKSHCSTASSVSSKDEEEEEEEEEQVPTATPNVNSFVTRDREYQQQQDMTDDALSMLSSSSYPPMPPLLSPSSESVVTPTSSGNSSLDDLVSASRQQETKEAGDEPVGPPKIAESTPLELRPHDMTGPVLFPSQQPQQAVVKPAAAAAPPPPPPTSPSLASVSSTSLAAKRRSIPTLSLPSLSPPAAAYAPSPSSSVPTPSSAFPSPKEKDGDKKALRAKKPSLKLLFSKRSASSLKSGKDKELGGHGWDRASTGMSFISAPIPQQQPSPGQTPLQQQQYVPYKGSPRSASDSSVSTPLSAVTAPQSSLPSSAAPSRSISAAGSVLNFPPVLDTPIEDSSLSLDYGFGVGQSSTTMLEEMIKTSAAAAAKEEKDAVRDVGLHQRQDEAPTRRAVMGRTGMQKLPVIEPLSIHHKDKDKDKEIIAPVLRPQASTSNLSISSVASSNHLNMFEDAGEEEEEDWTQSVLLAADSVDGSWAIQGPSGGSGGVGSSATKF